MRTRIRIYRTGDVDYEQHVPVPEPDHCHKCGTEINDQLTSIYDLSTKRFHPICSSCARKM